MKFYQILILFIFVIGAFELRAQDQFDDIIEEIIPKTKLTNEQLKNLRAEMRIQKMLIEGVKQIEINGGQFVNLEKSTNTLSDLMYSTIGAQNTRITSEVTGHVQDIVREGINKNALKEVLVKTRDFAYKFANDKKIFMSSMARRFGFDVGLVYLASMQVDLTFPMIMIAHGQPQYAALLATPVSSITTASYVAVKSAIKYHQVVKALGGLKNALHHLDIFRQMKSFFNENILLKYDLIDMKIAGRNLVLTVEKQNFISKTLSKLGWNKNLNYKNLIAVLEENEFLPELLENLKTSQRPDEVNLIRLLNKIESTNDPKIMSVLKDKFGKFINEVDGLPEFSKQRAWAVKIATSQSFDDFIRILGQLPDDFPPRVFDKVWRNYILIEASKNIAPSMSKSNYQAFRKLYDNYINVRRELTDSIEYSMQGPMREHFVEYIYDSLQTVGICQNLYRKKTPEIIPFL